MSIRGVGTDLTRVSRIERVWQRYGDRFVNRIAGDDAVPNQVSARWLAGHWALKEAAAKALGAGIGRDLAFSDIKINRPSGTAPQLKLPEATTCHASLSHEGDLVQAVVVIGD